MHGNSGPASTILALLALLTCGGAGGGVRSGAPNVVIPVTVQPPGTTVTYAVDSASAGFINDVLAESGIGPARDGSTITVSTDASGALSLVRFDIETLSASFRQSYNAAAVAAWDARDLSLIASVLGAVDTRSAANSRTTAPGADPTPFDGDLWGDE